jgi:oligopeptide transport system permease protein
MLPRALRSAAFGTPLAWAMSLWILLVGAAALGGSALVPWDPEAIDWDALEMPPSASHWLGTDLIGRDLLARLVLGSQVSLSVALVATLVSVLIGVPFGVTAGYLGGRADQLMMRLVDTLYALPFVLLVILLVVIFGREPLLLFAALGAVFWLDIARIVRGQTLRLREAEFVEAARALGASSTHIVLRHLIPNVMGPAIVYATLTIPGVILAESFISFLGLGIQEPNTSWGVLIADGSASMESSPWTLLFPALALGLTVWAFNMLGDRLRDALDLRAEARPGAIIRTPRAQDSKA